MNFALFWVFSKIVSRDERLFSRKITTYTVRLKKKKVTTFVLILHGLNSTNQIVICEHFKELQKMNNLRPVPSNLIDSFGFYFKMKTNISKPM